MYMTSYILVGKYRRFGGYFCLNLLLFNPENTLVILYQTPLRFTILYSQLRPQWETWLSY